MVIKNLLKTVFNEFVYGGHLAAMVGIFLVFITITLTKDPVSLSFLIIIYILPFIIYSFNRYKELKVDSDDNPVRTAYIKKRMAKIRITNFIYIFILLYLLFSLNVIIILYVLSLLILGILYTTNFKNFTRKVIAFKSVYVTSAWISVIPLYAIYHSISWNYTYTLIIIYLFVRLLIGINFFDLKDIKSDGEKKLQTLGVLFGIEKTEKILKILSIISVIPILIGIILAKLPLYAIVLLVAIPYTSFYFDIMKKGRISKEFLYYVIVNGEGFVWLCFLLFTKFVLSL